ncbi:MAG: radical SAM protein [Eubacteriaceae bacterium]|nr:radical SAM protein [Eubacteriaceae bacterium]
MKISKKDALFWFTFFAALPEEEALSIKQQEIALAVLAQIEEAVTAQNDALAEQIKDLKTLKGRTYFTGNESKFSDGCRACLTGKGLNAIRKTNKCNLKCKFCYDYGNMEDIPPIGENMWEIGGTRFNEGDIPLLLTIQEKPEAVCYVYLEPFMEIEKYYGIIKTFSAAGVHQHLYTNGVLANEDNLRLLGEAGLDEIRFNLGATDCSDRVIENIAIAKKHIPKVGIETPMTPNFYKSFMEKKERILTTGLDFINCAELHLNENNIANFYGEALYSCRLGYISPVYSKSLTLKFMKVASEEHWDICVHDCCNLTKFARELNLKSKEGGFFGESDYGCEFEFFPYEYFLPILRDDNFKFLEEEPLPDGYRPGQIVI